MNWNELKIRLTSQICTLTDKKKKNNNNNKQWENSKLFIYLICHWIDYVDVDEREDFKRQIVKVTLPVTRRRREYDVKSFFF